jgi:hypothetical protein
MVHGTGGQSLSVENKYGTVDRCAVCGVIEGRGAVPLDQVFGRPATFILIPQE